MFNEKSHSEKKASLNLIVTWVKLTSYNNSWLKKGEYCYYFRMHEVLKITLMIVCTVFVMGHAILKKSFQAIRIVIPFQMCLTDSEENDSKCWNIIHEKDSSLDQHNTWYLSHFNYSPWLACFRKIDFEKGYESALSSGFSKDPISSSLLAHGEFNPFFILRSNLRS